MTAFAKNVLDIDAEEVATTAAASMRSMTSDLKRRGLVVGVSGGVDSSVCAALAVRAVGPDRVTALLRGAADTRAPPREGHLDILRFCFLDSMT